MAEKGGGDEGREGGEGADMAGTPDEPIAAYTNSDDSRITPSQMLLKRWMGKIATRCDNEGSQRDVAVEGG
jgi:hypothetical protein